MSSIRVRLLVSILALLAVAAVAMGAVIYRNVLVEAEALFDYQLQQMALSLRDQGEIAPAEAHTLADGELDFVIQIWTVDGRSIYASREHTSLPARALLGLATLNVEGHAWRTYSVATSDKVIQVAQPVETRQRLAARAAWRGVLPLVLIAPVAALMVWWLAALNLAPLERVAAEVRSRDARSLAALSTEGLPDEVAPLVRSLNALLERLGLSLDAQRAFVADAAHELRSPLTALKLQLELLQRAGDEPDRAAARAALGEGIERATRLVEQLLGLARHEPGEPLVTTRVDLAGIARGAVDATAALAAARRVVVERAPSPPVEIDGAADSLALLARNVVDNAVRYSPPGSRVEVRVESDEHGARLVVDDEGPGIPHAERERVFDRFYRRPGNDEPGSGLGLAIVERIAEAHGATVALDTSPRGGLRVSVRFTRASLTPA